MSHRRIAAVITFTFVVGAAASMLWGQTGSPSTIYACVARDGTMRIVQAGVACKSQERALQWNDIGPAGPTGPQGEAGPQGEPGPPGEPGPVPEMVVTERRSPLPFPVASGSWGSVQAECIDGETVVGGGFRAGKYEGNPLPDFSPLFPENEPVNVIRSSFHLEGVEQTPTWRVEVHNISTVTFHVQAYAMCAKIQ